MKLAKDFLTTFWFPNASGRAMAWSRIVLGLALLYDTLSYLSDREAMFGQQGVLGVWGSQRPYPTLLNFFGFGGNILAPTSGTLDLIFAIFISAILFLTVGYMSRVAAAAAWLVLNYLMVRNHLVFDAGHNLAALLLFLMIFIPADGVGSVSAYLRQRSLKDLWQEKVIENAWAVRAMQIQISILYLSTFIYKLDGPNWRAGSAVYYASRLPPYFRPEFEFLVSSAFFIALATYGTLLIEGAAAVLIWVPRLRYYVLAAAIGFHLMLEATLVINIFQWVMIAGLLSFIEPGVSIRHKKIQ